MVKPTVQIYSNNSAATRKSESSDSDETLIRSISIHSTLGDFSNLGYFTNLGVSRNIEDFSDLLYSDDFDSMLNAQKNYEGLYYRHYQADRGRRNTCPIIARTSPETVDFSKIKQVSRRGSLQIPANHSLTSSGYYTDQSSASRNTDAIIF